MLDGVEDPECEVASSILPHIIDVIYELDKMH